MAYNDREYIILDKGSLLCRCRGAEYTGCGGADGCKVCFNFKTRAEYEDIIAESIYQQTVEQNQSYVLRPDVKTQKDFLEAIKKQCKIYAKAVVDRLFGEGE